jgi:hypothetical protein
MYAWVFHWDISIVCQGISLGYFNYMPDNFNVIFQMYAWVRSLLSYTDSCRNPAESGRIRAIPGIPQESNLAEGPAKLVKQFRQNFEWNSNSTGMVPGITWTELCRNGIHGICRAHNNTQIKHRCLTTNSLTTTTTIDNAHPLSPPRHRRVIATATSSLPSTSGNVCPHPLSTTSRP